MPWHLCPSFTGGKIQTLSDTLAALRENEGKGKGKKTRDGASRFIHKLVTSVKSLQLLAFGIVLRQDTLVALFGIDRSTVHPDMEPRI